MHFCCSCFFSHGFIQIRFGLFDLFCFVLRVTNIIYQKLMLLYFHYQKTSFSINTIFVTDEKDTQWNLDTKAKVFHKISSCFMKCPWNCISWNALEEKFHSVSFPLNKLKKYYGYIIEELAMPRLSILMFSSNKSEPGVD